MIPVAELDRIARARLEDAKALLQAGRYDGATYLCGYAVEVAPDDLLGFAYEATKTGHAESVAKMSEADDMIQAAEALLQIP